MFKKFLCLFLVIILGITVCGCAANIQIDYSPSKKAEAPYGNYGQEILIDAENGKFAVLNKGINSSLTLIDDKSQTTINEFSCDSFQLGEEYIFYQRENALYRVDINGENKTQIASDVEMFVVIDDNTVIYCTPTIHQQSYDERGYSYDSFKSAALLLLETQSSEKRLIDKDIWCFTVDGKNVYYITEDADIKQYSLSVGTTQILDSVFTYSIKSKSWFADNAAIYYSDERLIYPTTSKTIEVFDMQSKETETVWLDKDGVGPICSDELRVVCDDENVFAAFLKVDYNGSVAYTNNEHETNGLWRINVETLEAEKISSEYYENIYIADENLFAVSDGKIYLIDTDTGEAQRIN